MALVPFGVVTVTSTVPAVSAGETAVILVAESATKLVAPIAPNFTVIAPLKLVPVIVTVVPPPTGPLAGATFLTVGSADVSCAIW